MRLKLEHPAQEGLDLADAPAHRQIFQGVDRYEAVISSQSTVQPAEPPRDGRTSHLPIERR